MDNDTFASVDTFVTFQSALAFMTSKKLYCLHCYGGHRQVVDLEVIDISEFFFFSQNFMPILLPLGYLNSLSDICKTSNISI